MRCSKKPVPAASSNRTPRIVSNQNRNDQIIFNAHDEKTTSIKMTNKHFLIKFYAVIENKFRYNAMLLKYMSYRLVIGTFK